MATQVKQNIFEQMGVKPVINGVGIYTNYGGSKLSPSILEAMGQINEYYVSMGELIENSGKIIAEITGAEAARVLPGAAAANMLMTAAAMTEGDEAKGELIPHVESLKHEIVMQHNHDNDWKRQITMTGAKVAWAGDKSGTSAAQIEAAITDKTAALFMPAHMDTWLGTVPLAQMAEIAHRHNLPFLVDAAFSCWPLDNLKRFIRDGADLVCYSAKYFGGPNAGGFVAGKRHWVDAVMKNDFTRYKASPHFTYGRPLKMDRHTVVATVLALQEWLAMDHQARWKMYDDMVETMYQAVKDVPGIRLEKLYFTMEETFEPSPINSLMIHFDTGTPFTAKEIVDKLAAGTPSVRVNLEPNNTLFICMDAASPGDEKIIAERLRQTFGV